MRRHASRRSAGTTSTDAPAAGAIGRFALAFLAALCAAMLLAATASAKAPTFVSSFTPGGEISRVAVNEETGEFFVINVNGDGGNGAIDIFDEDGNAIGEIKGSETVAGFFGIETFGENWRPTDIAVDNSGTSTQGNVYLAARTESSPASIFAFEPTGSGYAEIWERGPVGSIASGVAVDSDGNPWIADFDSTITELSAADGQPAGGQISTAADGFFPDEFAFDSEGNFYLVEHGGRLFKYSSTGVAEATFLGGSAQTWDVAVDTALPERVYAGAQLVLDRQVWVFDTTGNEIPGTPFDPAAEINRIGVAVNSQTGRIYITTEANEVEVWQAAPDVTLTVGKAGVGSGTVSGGAIDCGGECAAKYEEDEEVTLTATPDVGSTFTGWTGCDSEPEPGKCTVTMTADRAVTATFSAPQTLTVSKSGSGSGTVTSTPAGISCGGVCSDQFGEGEEVTLAATPASGSGFAGWSGGGCSGTGNCVVTLTADTEVTADFVLLDSDGDGVPDNADACPSQFGTEANGCPVVVPPPPPPPADSDGDGVPDSSDACPSEAAATPNGCPEKADLLGQCVANANKAARKALKAAKRKKGKARAKAIKAAKKRKAKAIASCKARFS